MGWNSQGDTYENQGGTMVKVYGQGRQGIAADIGELPTYSIGGAACKPWEDPYGNMCACYTGLWTAGTATTDATCLVDGIYELYSSIANYPCVTTTTTTGAVTTTVTECFEVGRK